MNLLRRLGLCATSALVLATAAVSQPAWGVEPLRAGEGPRRAKLDAMELKPFKKDSWSLLADWKNGGAPTDAELDGKVVLIATWSDFHTPSKRALAMSKRLAESRGKDGLAIVVVHNERGWEQAEKPTAPEGVVFRVAHDPKGEFRKALDAAQDPNFYLIDRSGQMRYAAVRSESVEEAVDALLKEDKATAADTKARMEREKAEADRLARLSAALNKPVDLTEFPELPFPKPSDQEYADAKWPKMPRDPAKPNEMAYIQPKPMTLPETDWHPARPNFKGKAVVLYFWHPFMGDDAYNMFRAFGNAQRQFARDVVFVGVLTVFDAYKGINLMKEEKDPETLRKKLKEIYEARKIEHPLVFDDGGAMFSQVNEDQQFPMPFFVIMSSDNTARWWTTRAAVDGWAALRQIIEVDPAIKARRKAEDEWLKQQKPATGANAGAAPAAPAGTK